jgi:hypothetical protein
MKKASVEIEKVLKIILYLALMVAAGFAIKGILGKFSA